MTSTKKWGIIGLGKIANKFAEALQLVEGAKLYAVASRSIDSAQSFKEKHHATHAYGSYEELVQDPNVDLVYIATPHAFHKDHAILCLNHKKPVVCEKPLAHKYSDVRQMVDSSIYNQVFLMEAMWTRFLPSMHKALDLIYHGQIGTVKKVKADFGFNTPFDAKSRLYDMTLGGGSLMDVGVYPLFLALIVLGEPSGYEVNAKISSTGADEDFKFTLNYHHAVAELHSSIVADTPREAVITGTEGSIHFKAPWYRETSLVLKRKYAKEEVFTFPASGNGFEYQIREAMRCVAEGKIESVEMPHYFSLLQSKVLDILCKEAGIVYP